MISGGNLTADVASQFRKRSSRFSALEKWSGIEAEKRTYTAQHSTLNILRASFYSRLKRTVADLTNPYTRDKIWMLWMSRLTVGWMGWVSGWWGTGGVRVTASWPAGHPPAVSWRGHVAGGHLWRPALYIYSTYVCTNPQRPLTQYRIVRLIIEVFIKRNIKKAA